MQACLYIVCSPHQSGQDPDASVMVSDEQACVALGVRLCEGYEVASSVR